MPRSAAIRSRPPLRRAIILNAKSTSARTNIATLRRDEATPAKCSRVIFHLPRSPPRALMYTPVRPTNKPITWPFNLSSGQFPSNPADNFDVPATDRPPHSPAFPAYSYSRCCCFFFIDHPINGECNSIVINRPGPMEK